jgi:hypothetical protein
MRLALYLVLLLSDAALLLARPPSIHPIGEPTVVPLATPVPEPAASPCTSQTIRRIKSKPALCTILADPAGFQCAQLAVSGVVVSDLRHFTLLADPSCHGGIALPLPLEDPRAAHLWNLLLKNGPNADPSKGIPATVSGVLEYRPGAIPLLSLRDLKVVSLASPTPQ